MILNTAKNTNTLSSGILWIHFWLCRFVFWKRFEADIITPSKLKVIFKAAYLCCGGVSNQSHIFESILLFESIELLKLDRYWIFNRYRCSELQRSVTGNYRRITSSSPVSSAVYLPRRRSCNSTALYRAIVWSIFMHKR